MHTTRRWCVSTIDDADEISSGLTGNTQVLCTGIRYRGLLLLNDATHEDGGQEYAVIHEQTGHQVESLTASWMTPDDFRDTLESLAAGRNHCAMVTKWHGKDDPRKRIDTREEHGRCALCM